MYHSNQKLSNNHKNSFSKYYPKNKDNNNRILQNKYFELGGHNYIDITSQVASHIQQIQVEEEAKKNQNNK